jgi:acyl dehydratase
MMGQPSHLRAVARFLAQGLRSRRQEPAGRGAVPRRRLAVESESIVADPERVAAFLRVTDGERTPRFLAEGLLPPTFSALWETALALELLTLARVPLPSGGLVHLESEMVSLRPLRAGAQVRCRAELDRADAEPRGLRLTVVSRNWNAVGQLCSENTMVMLARGAEGGRAGGHAGAAEPGPAEGEPAWSELCAWDLRANHGRRYARVSGDFNPIHLWGWSSRLLGFRGPILHGFCTEALVAHALVERRLGGDPGALRRLQIAFRAPLSLPARVRLQVQDGTTGGRFRLVAADGSGKRPYAEGSYVGVGGA